MPNTGNENYTSVVAGWKCSKCGETHRHPWACSCLHIRQAIETRYAGPTDFQGARIIARAQAGRMIVPWDHALNPSQNAHVAALAYVARWGWDGWDKGLGRWVTGATVNGWVTVYVPPEEKK